MYTAIAHRHLICIPPEFLEQSIFENGERVLLSVAGDGLLSISKIVDHSDGEQHTVILNRANVPIKQDIYAEANIVAGDIVAFELVQSDQILIRRLEKHKAIQFEEPMLDENKRPIPPGWLIQPFTSTPNSRSFVNGGEETAAALEGLARSAGMQLGNVDKILDFGCGSGRILRVLPKYTDAKLIGCDLNKEALLWVEEFMPHVEVFTGSEYPPIPVADESVDLLYAISVFTHIDEQHQDQWLEEWRRVVRPGGLIIVTFKAEDFVDKCISNVDAQNAIKDGWEKESVVFANTIVWDGLFETFYGNTYQKLDYVKDHWAKRFEIVNMVGAGIFPSGQNVAVLRKP